jgi:hypothetical protein
MAIPITSRAYAAFRLFTSVSSTPLHSIPGLMLPGKSGQYGSQPPCGPTREYEFIYNILDTNQRRLAVQFLDLIPNNYYVVVLQLFGRCSTGQYLCE